MRGKTNSDLSTLQSALAAPSRLHTQNLQRNFLNLTTTRSQRACRHARECISVRSPGFFAKGAGPCIAKVVSFTSYQMYVTQLFQNMNRDPPPGHARCSVTQLARADRQVWKLLIQWDIKPRREASGDFALDGASKLASSEVSMSLPPTNNPEQPKKRPWGGNGNSSSTPTQSVVVAAGR